MPESPEIRVSTGAKNEVARRFWRSGSIGSTKAIPLFAPRAINRRRVVIFARATTAGAGANDRQHSPGAARRQRQLNARNHFRRRYRFLEFALRPHPPQHSELLTIPHGAWLLRRLLRRSVGSVTTPDSCAFSKLPQSGGRDDVVEGGCRSVLRDTAARRRLT